MAVCLGTASSCLSKAKKHSLPLLFSPAVPEGIPGNHRGRRLDQAPELCAEPVAGQLSQQLWGEGRFPARLSPGSAATGPPPTCGAGAGAAGGALPTRAVCAASPALAPRGLSLRAERGWRKPIPASGLGCSPCAGPVAARQAVAASRARLVPLQAFLYKALGTTLGACQELPHVQENLLQHLTRAQPEEPSEAQVSFPALSLGEGASPGPAPGSSSLPTTVAGHD